MSLRHRQGVCLLDLVQRLLAGCRGDGVLAAEEAGLGQTTNYLERRWIGQERKQDGERQVETQGIYACLVMALASQHVHK